MVIPRSRLNYRTMPLRDKLALAILAAFLCSVLGFVGWAEWKNEGTLWGLFYGVGARGDCGRMPELCYEYR